MTILDDAMMEHMIHIVFEEKRSFSFLDFTHIMKPKTYRNKICKLTKDEVVELDYKTTVAFHTLKGHKVGNARTLYHKGVTLNHNDPVYNMITNLPMDVQSIHDIHLSLKAPNLYGQLLGNVPYPVIEGNKSIAITWCKHNTIVRITINKNDTVSVIVGCSLEPIPLNYEGIIRFFTILGTVEGFLRGLLAMANGKLDQSELIPHYEKWMIMRWDFGRDGLPTYKGKKYEITVGKSGHMFARIYTKDFGKNKRIRIEKIESPKKTVADAIEEKLSILD
jgi:hypothetical protein